MASITMRNRNGGKISFRVQIKEKGIPPFYLTFRSLKEAKNWVKKHEASYLENPAPYRKWRDENRKSITRGNVFVPPVRP